MIALVVVLAMSVGWLLVGPPPETRLGRLLARRPQPRARRSGSPMLARVAGATAALGVWLVVGGAVGLVLAAACVVVVPRLARHLEPRAARHRRDALERQAPLLADLLSATMASGAPMGIALAAVSAALGEPTRDALRPVLTAMGLGAEPAVAWQAAADAPALRPVVEAIVRSAQSGAPLSTVLSRLAEDMRRDRKASVEVAARSAGVRAVAPLAACFLPAFLLVGVVPVVASLAGALLS